jgi:hypothetical protein
MIIFLGRIVKLIYDTARHAQEELFDSAGGKHWPLFSGQLVGV